MQAGSSFVQYQDPRISQNGSRDGDALLLSTGEFHAALADDGVVLIFKCVRKFIDARDATGGENFGFGCFWTRKRDVLPNGAIKEKRLLQHYAELGAIGVELGGGKIDTVN